MSKEMKLTKSRIDDNCHECKKDIKRGSHYLKKTISIGKPNKETHDGEHFVSHGFRVAVKICQACLLQELVDNALKLGE
tara:strand:+ start:789 stop:1025 length:237 start_codon:yes stop_codon:yes gene_type:complete